MYKRNERLGVEGLVATGVAMRMSLGVDILDSGNVDDLSLDVLLLGLLHDVLDRCGGDSGSVDLVAILDRSSSDRRRLRLLGASCRRRRGGIILGWCMRTAHVEVHV